jgi:hypothetical protein
MGYKPSESKIHQGTKIFYFHWSTAHHKNEQSLLEKAVTIYNNVNEFCTLKPAKTISLGSIRLTKHMLSVCITVVVLDVPFQQSSCHKMSQHRLGSHVVSLLCSGTQ